MRTSVCLGLALLAAMSASIGAYAGAEELPLPSAADAQYRPPAEYPAPRRIGGASRGMPLTLPTVAVLAPDHLGLTRSEQPRLYWFISAPTSDRVEAVLIRPGMETPLIETVLSGAAAGIHFLDLRQLGVRLELDIEYEWSVAVVTDPAQRSRDIVSGGAIMRIQAPADDATDAAQYARLGLWYDALMALDRNSGEQAADATARSLRTALLEQAGLLDVVLFERR